MAFMNRNGSLTVSQVAQVAHVTVRALHHYDEIGLLVPSGRGPNGYRLYDDGDLARLQQILLFRQLGFGLDAIGQLVDAAVYERRQALEAQRALLLEQRDRTNSIIRGVDAAIAALENGVPMDTTKMFDGFDEFDPSKYEEEAKERWGQSEAYKESMKRTRSYSKAQWTEIKAEGDAIFERMAAAMASGIEADSDGPMDLAEAHREHIDRWFYPCSHEMHEGLSSMYTADPRFAAFFEKFGAGLAEYVRHAIEANVRRAAGRPA